MAFFILTLILLGGGLHVWAKSRAAALKHLPDHYPPATIKQEPQGDETWVETPDGTRIRAVAAGSGPTVVLAHGYGYTVQEWNLIWTMLLEAGYRVIAFDQRGHGKSTIGTEGIGSKQMAGDYRAVLEHYAVQDAILVGHSMGGFLAQVFILTYPEVAQARLKALVLFATFAGNILQDAPQNRIQLPLIKYGILTRILTTDYGWLFGASLMGKAPAPAVIQVFLNIFEMQNHQKLIPIIEAFGSEDYYERIGDITLPTVVICGEMDNTTPRWHSEKLGKLIPNARNVWVKDRGHLLNWEAPDTLIEAVRSLS